MLVPLNRREFLTASAAGVASGLALGEQSKVQGEPIAFFLVGDTHYLANKEDTAKLDERSATVTGRLVDLLNKLPGTEIPKSAGGGKVFAPRGLIHAGDCIDTGDKPNVKMQETE